VPCCPVTRIGVHVLVYDKDDDDDDDDDDDCSTAYELHHNGNLEFWMRLLKIRIRHILGVYVNIGLKPSTQCAKSANSAMSVLRMVTIFF